MTALVADDNSHEVLTEILHDYLMKAAIVAVLAIVVLIAMVIIWKKVGTKRSQPHHKSETSSARVATPRPPKGGGDPFRSSLVMLLRRKQIRPGHLWTIRRGVDSPATTTH